MFNHLSHQKLLKVQVMFQKAVSVTTENQGAEHSELTTAVVSLHSAHGRHAAKRLFYLRQLFAT